MRRLTHLIVLCAFIFSCGGHWYVFQAVAWVNMIRDYSQFVPLTEAVSMTFSGQYPCHICQAIAEKKQSENNKLCSIEKYDKKSLPPVAITVKAASSASLVYTVFSTPFLTRTDSPPTPPPRLA